MNNLDGSQLDKMSNIRCHITSALSFEYSTKTSNSKDVYY